MNAPAAPAAVQTSVLPLNQIVPSSTHIQLMRRERFSAPLLQELAKSIGEIGVLQAIVVRPRRGADVDIRMGTQFELVAGERRWLAAKIAGLTTIPATVRELNDEQVLKAQLERENAALSAQVVELQKELAQLNHIRNLGSMFEPPANG